MEKQNKNKFKENKENINSDNINNKIIDNQNILNILNNLFVKDKNYSDIIEPKKIIKEINNNIDNFYNSNNNNENKNNFNKDTRILKYKNKFERNINFISKKLFFSNKAKMIIKNTNNKKDHCILINIIFILKKYINDINHIYLKKFSKILIFLEYSEILSEKAFKFIIEFYINIFIDFIIKKNNISFIDDLIEGMSEFPIQNKNLFISIIDLFEEYFIDNLELKLRISNSFIWQKLLSNTTYSENSETSEKLYHFLVNVYKYKLNINFLFDHIYKKSVIDLNYYCRAIKLLSEIFSEEETKRKDNTNFNIMNGFCISYNNPLILEKIKFKENEFSLIFSFRIIDKQEKEKEIIIFNLYDRSNKHVILKLIINKDDSIKIIHGNKDWKLNKIKIMKNKDYLICLSQSSFPKKNICFFINDINEDNIKLRRMSNKNVNVNLERFKSKKVVINNSFYETKSSYPTFDSEMSLELGESNFKGIIGDFIIINKKLNENEISNLYSLNENYSYVIENINAKYDLVNKLDYFFSENNESLIFFQNLKYKCILKILSYKINNKFIKDKKQVKIDNIGKLKHKNNDKIKVIEYKYSIDFFYCKNGIEFLTLQLHNILNHFNSNENNNLDLFNYYLYQTLNFFYDIITIIDDDNMDNKKNDNLKFSYFILSFMIILYNLKRKNNNNLNLDYKIYDLLIKYTEFYSIHNYYIHRNIIISILLDDFFFDQKEVLKDGKIFIYLRACIQNILNKEKDKVINKELLLKILNLDFVLESKEYRHKFYMKLIISLLSFENSKIYQTIIKYIININNEVKLYHYLKYIYIHYDSLYIELKKSLRNEKRFILFLKNYSEKEINDYHCKYCFNIIFLVYQFKGMLINEDDKIKHINKNDGFIKDKEFFFKYKTCLIKFNFINCFNLNNEIKLKIIKNYKYYLTNLDTDNKNANTKSDGSENKNEITSKELNFFPNIRINKLLQKFDSIINDLFFIYDIYCEEQKNNLINKENMKINENNNEIELINNLFEIMKFFMEELINYFKKGKNISQDYLNFLYEFLKLRGISSFFKIYLKYDYNSAINILQEIILLSINKIKYPFYFEYIEIDENIDSYNKINNEKIKNKIIETIFLEIRKINSDEEILKHNRIYLLIIINEIVKNVEELKNDIGKYFINYLKDLLDKKIFHKKILFKVKGEYYNLLELSLNILINVSKIYNYNKQCLELIQQFIILKNNKSIFYLIDDEYIVKNKKKYSNINNNKELDFSSIIYCIYFLIYFIEIKNYLILSGVNDKNEEKKDKNENNQINILNSVINVIFNNSKEIVKLISNKKGSKQSNSKLLLNIINLDIYHNVFSYFTSNIKKKVSFEEFEKYYNEIKISELQSKKISLKEQKQIFPSVFLENVDDKDEKSNNDIYILNIYHDNINNIDEDMISGNVIENYFDDKNNDSEQNKKKNSFSSFRFRKKAKTRIVSYFNDKIKRQFRKISDNNILYSQHERINEKEKFHMNNILIKDEEDSSFEDSSSCEDDMTESIKGDENMVIDDNNKNNKRISLQINSLATSSFSITNSILEEETNSIIDLDIKKYNLSKKIQRMNIPLFYYQKLINDNHFYYLRILINPKINLLWKLFAYTFRDIIFNNKNFIKLSKAFKIYSKNFTLEMSSKDEKKYFLNYPTKVKNFICNDYYRPFLKPDMKFFNRELLKISHNYLPKHLFAKIKLEEKLSNIKFTKFIPFNENDKNIKYLHCENVSYKGSIFGKLYFLDNYFIFINKDYSNVINDKEFLNLFMFAKEDINKNKEIEKIILFFYNEIKEIIIRRFCLKYIGYEIFLKDGRSYLFNFFQKDKINDFNNFILSKNKEILINNPIAYFEKKDYKTKFKRGEISNFHYLLLINKFATRTYNNNCQYLVFPLIYMNIKDYKMRDLSKAICLNKEKSQLDKMNYKTNFELMNCHFNNHYSTSGYILYYLIRLIPYTYLLIDFQSGKFDVPDRIFSNYNSYYISLISSSENRELLPEFFHNFESCLNLNYNNFGKIQKTKILVNNFNSNLFKNSIEFIINHRKSLDKSNIVPWINNIFGCNQINDSEEIMNIFPLHSYEQYNDYDKDIKEMKNTLKPHENQDLEIYNEMRSKIQVLDFGITPIQLFKTVHPLKLGVNNNNPMNDLRSSINISTARSPSCFFISNTNDKDENNINTKKNKNEIEKKYKEKINELFLPIKNFISNQNHQKYNIILNNHTLNIFFIFKRAIVIHNIYSYSNLNNINSTSPPIVYPVKINLTNNLISIESIHSGCYKNVCSELMTGFYCICRNDNKTIILVNYNKEYIFSYLWINIVTAIEPYNYSLTITNSFSEYKWKLYFGDEEGNLCILDSNFKYYINNKIEMISMKLSKKIKIHRNYINNILYNERLNIVVSSSGNGDIAINNAFSLEILNIIEIGKNYFINNFEISFYDLLYVSCYNHNNKNYYIKCFTLNGIKVTKLKSETKIVNFFINDYVNIFYEDKTYDKFCLYDFKDKINDNNGNNNISENEFQIKEDYNNDKENGNKNKLIHCKYCKKINKMINIYDNNEMHLEDLEDA